MAKVTEKYNESFTSLLRRFKSACDEDKIVQQVRDRKTFQKPSVVKKIAQDKAVRRLQQKLEKENEVYNKKY